MFKKFKVFYLLLIVAFLVTACGTKDLTQGKSAQEIIEESYEKQLNIENYDMDLAMDMKMPMPEGEIMAIAMTGKATVFQKPMQMKLVVEITNPETSEPVVIEQYMEATEQGINIYEYVEEQWFKIVLNDPALAETMNMDPTQNVELFLKYLKETNIIGEEKLGQRDTLKIELVASSEMYNELMEQIPGMNLNQPGMEFTPDFLSQMGDMKYIVWVDKTTLDIVKTSMDLTENMQNMGKALIEQGLIPAELAEMFSNMEMSMTYEILNINKAEPIVIPEEAKNAPELPMN
jgi:outer membrane lipoprotein-sorting protein